MLPDFAVVHLSSKKIKNEERRRRSVTEEPNPKIREEKKLILTINRLTKLILLLIGCVVGSCVVHLGIFQDWFDTMSKPDFAKAKVMRNVSGKTLWQPPDTLMIPSGLEGELITYGRELIAHTSVYLGPKGKVRSISNGMNCQNCHLDAGTKIFGNNYSRVAANYPKFRSRSGMVEGFAKRINDCIERSLNGTPLDEDSHEMQAIIAYLKWIGNNVPKDKSPEGSGLVTLSLLDRPADTVKGKAAYANFCGRCHGDNGEGIPADSKAEWRYPPLWGKDSYNTGAGLYRISKFAAFIKANMPFGITYENPLLTDEEAWDIAAYVNSMPRPQKDLTADWPDISKKPVDHPFGPYADSFSEAEHKYGPFGPITAEKNNVRQ